MKNFSVLALFCTLAYASGVGNENPLLVVVGLDGLRYDFMDATRTPFLWSIAQKGVYSPRGISAQFYTVTAPNFFCISTGLYQESHGIVGNTMWDPVWQEYYDYWGFKKDEQIKQNSTDPKWYSGEPIWRTNEKAGNKRASGVMRWAHCDVPFGGATLGPRCVPYANISDESDMRRDIDTMVSWFTDPTNPVNLAMLYIEEPDHVEHYNDIYSDKVKETILMVDGLMKYMFNEFKETGLLPRINFIFTSDHGFINYDQRNSTTILSLDPTTYLRDEINIFPKGDQSAIDELYRKLQEASLANNTFSVYKKADIPENWHYKNNRRIGPLVLAYKLGHYIALNDADLIYGSRLPVIGRHEGYMKEHDELRPFFMAHGPALKAAYQLPYSWDAENIDLYNLFCKILKVAPEANNGTFSKMSGMLKEESTAVPTTRPSSTAPKWLIQFSPITLHTCIVIYSYPCFV